jgi:photoactive yellow protein
MLPGGGRDISPGRTTLATSAHFESVVTETDALRIASMASGELDRLPFGAIRLDKDGKILSYNLAEATLTGRDPKKVVGLNFFTDVAPCTNVRDFAGRFREGVARGELHETFPYVFDFKMAPRRVTVTLFYSQATEAAWVFVRERAAA